MWSDIRATFFCPNTSIITCELCVYDEKSFSFWLCYPFGMESKAKVTRNLPVFILAISCVVAFVAGCKKETSQEFVPGKVEATQAYLEHYGEPPQGKAGRAYARVGYLPTQDNPPQLKAKPIFIFSTQNELQKILEKLISGDLIFDSDKSVFNPFPTRLTFELEPIINNTLKINLSTPDEWEKGLGGALGALAETALQFDEVSRVVISINGDSPPGMPEGGYIHDESIIGELGPPQLILMMAAWEGAEKDPKEVLIEFDRPIEVREFELYHEGGEKVEGDYYTSIFQMAVVVRPKQPQLFQEGTVLKAKWSVMDELGRSSRGETMLPLEKYVH